MAARAIATAGRCSGQSTVAGVPSKAWPAAGNVPCGSATWKRGTELNMEGTGSEGGLAVGAPERVGCSYETGGYDR
ncbi:MAG: hypothetical protein ACRDH6_06835 [Actinomycetota bacterium]